MKNIPGFPGYKATKDGQIFSVKAKRYLKPSVQSAGYLTVSLYQNSKQKTMTVHRAVMLAYGGVVDPSYTIDHINNCKRDNRLSNLRYVSRSENTRKGNLTAGRTKLTEALVAQIKKALAQGEKNKTLAARYAVDASVISNIKRGKAWSHVTV